MHRVRGIIALGLAVLCPSRDAQSQSDQSAAGAKSYRLEPTSKTVTWGYYAAAAPPVLRIRSGDTVEIRTLITSSPKRLEEAGVAPRDVEQSLH
jgi:FtsP/CotA-like multicopper oxidase with cupredoxin domain